MDGVKCQGFYIGRKHLWDVEASFIAVMVIESDRPPYGLEVYEPGRGRSHLRDWFFVGKVTGLREITASYRRAVEAWEAGD